MNERINKLWNKTCGEIQPEMDGTEMTNQRKQKFAQLIMEECVKINLEILSFTAYAKLYQRYQEHFEVDAKLIKAGSRVKVISGFNVGAKGTVSYIEPTGKMWVLRDGANSDVFYHPEEVIGIEE